MLRDLANAVCTLALEGGPSWNSCGSRLSLTRASCRVQGWKQCCKIGIVSLHHLGGCECRARARVGIGCPNTWQVHKARSARQRHMVDERRRVSASPPAVCSCRRHAWLQSWHAQSPELEVSTTLLGARDSPWRALRHTVQCARQSRVYGRCRRSTGRAAGGRASRSWFGPVDELSPTVSS